MSKALAVYTPTIGARSETFIRRHVEDLLPGKTAVISTKALQQDGWHLNGDHPRIALDEIRQRFGVRAVYGIKRGLGLATSGITTKKVGSFLKEKDVEVILGEYLHSSLWLLPIAKEFGIRFFAHAHGYDISLKLRDKIWREAYLKYNEADGVIAMSTVCAERLADLGIARDKIHVIPYGVDVPPEPKVRNENKTIRCLAVGRMVGKKAPILLLDAFRRAVEQFPEMRLDYIGTGPLFAAASQFVSAFDLKGKVTLHGAQAHGEVKRLMAEADIFVQHSMTDPETGDEEGMPVAILEAMAHGLPVVSTFHAGIPEAVINGSTGYLVEEGDSVGMAHRVVDLARDSDRRSEWGLAGHQRAKDMFTWEAERSQLLRVMGLDDQK